MEETPTGWLALAYSLPAEPSRKRVSVWRHLRKIGAVYMNEGFWLLPNTEAAAQQLDVVTREVDTFGGSAIVFAAYDLSPDQKERLQNRFLQMRNEEYEEIHKQGLRLLAHIHREREREKFHFPEVEELEEDLEKFERWLGEVRQRDVLGSPFYETTRDVLLQCKDALASFTEEAFERSRQGGVEA